MRMTTDNRPSVLSIFGCVRPSNSRNISLILTNSKALYDCFVFCVLFAGKGLGINSFSVFI